MTAPAPVSPELARVIAQLRQEIADEIKARDDAREVLERDRSLHRNGNRLLVLVIAFVINIAWPTYVLHVLHSHSLGFWTPALSSGADLLVTWYAMQKRY